MTLTHPHGQIYGYPYLTPRTAAMLRAGARVRNSRRQPVRGLLAARWPTAVVCRAHRAVHRVRAVRGALAGGGAHLSEPVRAQPP